MLVGCKTQRYAPAQHPRAPALSQRMSLGDYRGSQPASRVKRLDNGDLEDGVAGESDGRSAGEITVGWGGLVRRAFFHLSHCVAAWLTARRACWQFKLSNARFSKRPERGKLKVMDIEVLEVPAMSSSACKLRPRHPVVVGREERGCRKQGQQGPLQPARPRTAARQDDRARLPGQRGLPRGVVGSEGGLYSRVQWRHAARRVPRGRQVAAGH